MDTKPVDRRLSTSDIGLASIQFVLAAGMSLILFLLLANVVVVQYGRGAMRSALEQGARAGTTSGPNECEAVAAQVVADLLGGAMSEGLVVRCSVNGAHMVASGDATFQSWTPFTPDFPVSITTRASMEP